MKTADRNKNNYGVVIISVLMISVLFGFLFDIIVTAIECYVYPKPDEYRPYIEKYSIEFGVPEELIYSVIKTESSFNSSAVSEKGATGLMQIMPSTFQWLTNDILHEYLAAGMIYDPETNIKYGTYYLCRLYRRFEDWDTAIAAYNGGEGNVSEWLKDPRYSDDGKKLKINSIPKEFDETEKYVNKVNKALKKYRELYQ